VVQLTGNLLLSRHYCQANQATEKSGCEDNLKTFVDENKLDAGSVAGTFFLQQPP
jgi:hypothetical protein